jgi:hypothetical protein
MYIARLRRDSTRLWRDVNARMRRDVYCQAEERIHQSVERCYARMRRDVNFKLSRDVPLLGEMLTPGLSEMFIQMS